MYHEILANCDRSVAFFPHMYTGWWWWGGSASHIRFRCLCKWMHSFATLYMLRQTLRQGKPLFTEGINECRLAGIYTVIWWRDSCWSQCKRPEHRERERLQSVYKRSCVWKARCGLTIWSEIQICVESLRDFWRPADEHHAVWYHGCFPYGFPGSLNDSLALFG